MADGGGIVCILNNGALSMSGVAVIDVQREQEGSEDTALGELRCSTIGVRRCNWYSLPVCLVFK